MEIARLQYCSRILTNSSRFLCFVEQATLKFDFDFFMPPNNEKNKEHKLKFNQN